MFLKNLFTKNAGKPNPRFVDINLHDWDKRKSPMEYFRTLDVIAGVTSGVALSFNAAATYGVSVAAANFAVCVLLSVGTSAGLKKLNGFDSNLRALLNERIDREGRSIPPKNNTDLLMKCYAVQGNFRTFAIANGALFVTSAIVPYVASVASGSYHVTVPTACINAALAGYFLQGYLTTKALTDKKYVFCDKPTATQAQKTVALPAAFRPKAA